MKHRLIFLLMALVLSLKVNAQSSPPISPFNLSRSDIPFSPRWYWYSRLPGNVKSEIDGLSNGLNTKADEFYANRFLWTYREYLNYLDSSSGLPNPNLPTFAANYTNPRSSQYAIPLKIDTALALDFFDDDIQRVNEMLAVNLCDNPLRSSWEIDQGWSPNRPDYNSDDFLDFQISQIESLVDDGNVSFHQDNAGGNETSIDFGGSFSEASMTKFNDWIANNRASEFNQLGIGSLSSFNYKSHLWSQFSNGGPYTEEQCNCLFSDIKDSPDSQDPEERLKYYFREFQRQATTDYYEALHTAIDEYISNNFGSEITRGIYSANNHLRNKWLTPNLIFGPLNFIQEIMMKV